MTRTTTPRRDDAGSRQSAPENRSRAATAAYPTKNDLPEAARAAVEFVEGRRELGEPGAGGRERPRELSGPLFQLLRARGRLLPQLGRRP